MFVAHAVILAALAVVFLTAVGNVMYMRRTGRARTPRATPLVSVLVPARDEARRIGSCLEALAAVEYPSFEVLVLDDDSSDATAAIAESYRGRVPGLRVIRGEPLPSGWVGKSHACAQLARHARGEWLLFTDADVAHGPASLARGVAAAEATGADLLTALPRQLVGSFAELLTIPLLYFAVAGFLPMFLLAVVRSSRMAAASGQYMLFRRSAYERIGGHAAVRADVVEDVALARAIRRARLRLVLVNGVDFVSCRMYTSAAEVVEGFSKNAYAGIGGSLPSLAALVAVAVALFVAPPVGLLFAGAAGLDWRPLLAETLLALTARLALAVAFAQPLASVPLHPVSVAAALGIAFRSFWLTHFAGGVRWKGRTIGR